MTKIVCVVMALACSGCVMMPAYVDQNSLAIGRLQGEVDTLKWTLNRERYTTTYMK